jgi:signal transduction histidine kinase
VEAPRSVARGSPRRAATDWIVTAVPSRERRSRLLLLLLLWAIPAIVAGFGVLLVPYLNAPDIGYGGALLISLAHWAPWAAWALVVFALCDRFPLERGRLGRALAVHVPISLLTMLLMIGLLVAVDFGLGLVRAGLTLQSRYILTLRSYAEFELILYWAVVGAHAALRWHEAFTTQNALRAQLEADLSDATLRALKAQLNPHFLFNALNSVMTLITSDPPAAQRMLVRLSELLRITLATNDAQEVSVEQELELVERYLEIERIRFGDRLAVVIEADAAARGSRVPALVLQPLVENAIVHGLSQRPGPGRVEVRARVSGPNVVLSVRDDGPGMKRPSSHAGAGIGLGNLRSRLERLYGAAFELAVSDDPRGGACVTVVIPSVSAA